MKALDLTCQKTGCYVQSPVSNETPDDFIFFIFFDNLQSGKSQDTYASKTKGKQQVSNKGHIELKESRERKMLLLDSFQYVYNFIAHL